MLEEYIDLHEEKRIEVKNGYIYFRNFKQYI